MAKSIRSKIKKRFRTVKRQRVDAMIHTPQNRDHYESLKRVGEGRQFELSQPKNAFLEPDAPGAVFPQRKITKPIDFRSSHLPMAGFCFKGNRRKYSPEEQEQMNVVMKTHHPKIEVLAGGGAILASTGKRVSEKDAALFATAAENPAMAARAAAAMAPSAASTDAEAAAAAAAQQASAAQPKPTAALDMEMDPENEADHTRRPIIKDVGRAKRTAEHRPRPNSVKKNKHATKTTAAPKAAPSAPNVAAPAASAAVAAPAPGAASSPAPAPAPAPVAAATQAPPPAGAGANKKKKNNAAKK